MCFCDYFSPLQAELLRRLRLIVAKIAFRKNKNLTQKIKVVGQTEKNTYLMISIQNLNKSFKDGLVLTGFNLEVKEGEFVVVFGPNGCGKTTLLNLLANLDPSFTGEIKINSKKVKEAKTGMIFQNYHEALLPWLTLKQNIELVSDENKVEKWIEKLDLTKIARKYPYEVSGGQKQLTCIARAFAYAPEVLLFDEPFSALDYSNKIKLQEELQKVWLENKKTTLFIAHDPEEAVFLADRIIILSQRPGVIKKEIKVNLTRPRNSKTRTSKKFLDYRKQVIEAFLK